MNTATPIKVALTGDVALELIASYFQDAGYDVMPQDVTLDVFKPDFVYDVTSHDAVLATEVPGFRDERLMKLAGCPYSADGIRAIVDEFAWFRTAAVSRAAATSRTAAASAAESPKKILAVDADNTLWKGILTEDGPNALVPCEVFQAGLKSLADEGVVIVLLSKNNEEEVADYLHATGMSRPLFAAHKVNWAPKAGNLVEACRELNLGTDSVVFVDDNPHERAQMKAHLPEVTVAPWSGWPETGSVPVSAQRQLIRRLREYFFTDVGRTAEDRLRAHDYRAASARLDILHKFASHDDYLDDLGLWVKPSLASSSDLDRLAQMAGKTNQFNATTIRRSRDEFAALLESETHRVFVFRAGDRFGEQGLVCYVVADLAKGRITDFVMSCRAMGRTLEYFALAYAEKALERSLEIDFVPSAKNRPFADFLASIPTGLKTHFKEVR